MSTHNDYHIPEKKYGHLTETAKKSRLTREHRQFQNVKNVVKVWCLLMDLKKKKVLEAVGVLRQLQKTGKPDLLQEEEEIPVFLQVSIRRIPTKQSKQTIRVDLPHSLLLDSTEVCLITGDLDKKDHKAESEPVALHYKEHLRNLGITRITEVMPLRQLRTEHKQFESKRHLVAAYDVFLCDSKIAGTLPRLLGKNFFRRRKFPAQVRMKAPNLKEQIEKALSQTTFRVNCRGDSVVSEVARLGMSDKQIVQNIMAATKILSTKIPGQEGNIVGMYVKTAKSKAIPLYMAYGDGVKLPKVKAKSEAFEDELSTMPNTRVKVWTDGRVLLKEDPEEE